VKIVGPINRASAGTAFTLVELLVVIGIIGILASLLLSSFSGVLRRSKETVCVNNFRQIGIMFRLYGDEHEDGFPPSRVPGWDPVRNLPVSKRTDVAVGGVDPQGSHFMQTFPFATNRPLHAYQGSGDSFRFPVDKGHKAFPEWPICTDHEAKPTMFQTVGSSYRYNAGLGAPWDPNRAPPLPIATKLPRYKSLPRMTYGEVEHPDRYILMNEPAAQPIGRRIDQTTVVFYWSQWHRRRGRSDFADPTIAPNLFWSPVLFVDGHVGGHNFSKSVMADPYYPYEETRDWIWYQPK
jgi:prepilin-type N-terminal cleavage/methylation domain-containing protein/prepilin-type processing-associated H-X9-DG protein